MSSNVYIYSHPYGVYGWEKWLAFGKYMLPNRIAKSPIVLQTWHLFWSVSHPCLQTRAGAPHLLPQTLCLASSGHFTYWTLHHCFFEPTLTYAVSCSPSSKAEVHAGCGISFYFLPTHHMLACLTPLRPWIREMRAALSVHFFPGHSGFDSPLSHPPSVYLPCKQKTPNLCHPSLYGGCFSPLILACHPSPHQQHPLGQIEHINSLQTLPVSPRAFFSPCNYLLSWYVLRMLIPAPRFPSWGKN